MAIERQNIQLRLAFPEGDWGEAPGTSGEGTEMSVAVCAPESPAEDGSLMEEVCERENLTEALKRVRANRGSPGVDGMRVDELAGYLREHWPAIREQLLEGSYVPRPVKRVEIPKRGGGERRLGIPTVLDRFIQQAVLQVLQKHWDRAWAWAAGAGPGDAPFTIDLDSTICETYGLAKEGARHHDYTGKRGYHPLLAIAAGTGDVLMSRLREGRANTARGAAHFLREMVGQVRYAGANGRLTLRADSGFYTHDVVSVCRKMDVRFSITIRQHKSLRNLIEAIPEDAWTPIPYWMDGAADVAETTCTPFQSEPDAAPVRLIVRRVKPTPGSQLALFASYSYHGFITDRDGEMLELEADHRRHAEIENAIRDLKHGVGLNHLPSGRFAANAAWLAVQVMAHNLARWTARIGLGQQIVTTKTPQTTGLCLGRTDHPLGTPIDPASSPALALGGAVQPRPGPTASHSVLGLTASLQLTQRPRNLAPPRSRESPAAYPFAIPRIATPA